ncbi:hypothetical protein LZU85_14145 [Vibrio sp. IRLE0018]|uniref:hypothetical protein n=1 Tax=Vibrio floridensis TaxID=2908007 RepID=UPI001F1B3319|nr:hypothetical protein [Vibrio floridensis]MCF8779943.1 hypothetical protein [Vibrio floridensis]
MALQNYSQQMAKLVLYRQALPPPDSPPQELFSFVRIGGQLCAEQTALNTSVLARLTQFEAANDATYSERTENVN